MYKIIRVKNNMENTENMLNALELAGWKVICSYSRNNEHIILWKED